MLDYKLLIIGNLYDNHLVRFIKILKEFNPNIIIDVLTFKKETQITKDVELLINTIYWFNPFTTKNRLISVFQRIRQFNTLLTNIADNKHYDVINIHFPIFDYSFSLGYLKRLGNKIVLTPWGSDVYRVGKIKLLFLKYLYKKTDYVCLANTRFGNDVRKLFNLNKTQIANLSFGSEMIDYIAEHKNEVTVTEARKKLSLEGDYFITCGYNAHVAQNHKDIIDGIEKIKESFAGQLALIFPMTYPKNNDYIERIKGYVSEKGLKAYFFTDYLDLTTLFYLRQSTDMFIHIQDTDANSASLQEYLLLGKKVLNGEWLRYDNLEIDGFVPYTLVENRDSLADSIMNALKENIQPNDNLFLFIESYGWKKWIIHWDSFFKQISIS